MVLEEDIRVFFHGLTRKDKFAHAFLTAAQLEDEMRKVRVKEWDLRDKIAEIDKELAKI